MNLLIKRAAALAVLTMLAIPAVAHEQGEWIVRGGIGVVSPDNAVYTDPDDSDFSIDVDDGTSLTLTGTYMFTPNWAVDILAAWPFSHDIDLNGVGKIAETDHLPPTFSLQYHFIPTGKFQPYAGVGLNYTTFFSTDTTGALTGTDLDLDDSFGIAAQVGADVMLNERWLVNFDFRWISIESDATVSDSDGEIVAFEATLDPFVYSVSLGYKF